MMDVRIKTDAEKMDFTRMCLGDCSRCGLARTRKNIVFGHGEVSARIMLIGDMPNYHENKTGKSFVGYDLIQAAMDEVQIAAEDVYVTNVLKCKTPKSRQPTQGEVDKCLPFLLKQIDAVEPRVIVTMGSVASACFFEIGDQFDNVWGQWRAWAGIPALPIPHYAVALNARSKARKDAAKASIASSFRKVSDWLSLCE